MASLRPKGVKRLTKNTSHNKYALIKNSKTFLQMTLKQYNLYMTQHQKHFLNRVKTLLTLLMNIILCDSIYLKNNTLFFALMEGVETKFKILS